jgi:hypothetical protein
VARDRRGTGNWFDAAPRAALGIGPADGRWIQVAGLADGLLPVTTADGWHARRTAHGAALPGPADETMEAREPAEIRAFGFSPDGQAFIVADSPSLTIFQRNGSDQKFHGPAKCPFTGSCIGVS